MANEKIKKWAVADCETDAFCGDIITPFVWAFLDSDGNRAIFWNTAEFVDWLKNFSGIVYAHNGGRFDWLMPEIVREFNEGKIMLINGRVARANIGAAEIRDSYLCLPCALEKFGEKDDFDYKILDKKHTKQRGANKAKIEKYIMQDCVALFNAMEKYIERFGHALTQAGAALKTWENMGGEKRRYGKKHHDKFSPFYFGGRCEVFEYAAPLVGNFKMYDINSSYPAAMLHDHCVGEDYVLSANYKKAHPSSFWIVRGVSRGALCIREGARVWFPNDGEPREYFTTGWELKAALELGLLDIESARGLVPRRFENFAPYVNKFFEERAVCKAAGDKIGDIISKIFMNSLYGKFGANPANYKDYEIVEKSERKKGWSLSYLLDDLDILERPTQAPQYFDVAVAASITGYARAALMRGIFNSVRVLYCDTDSVLCEKFGGEEGDKLGQWKYEGDFRQVWIAGKKCYALESTKTEPEDDKKRGVKKGDAIYKTAHKGVSKLDATVDDVKRAAMGEIVTIKKSAPNCKINGTQDFIARRIRKT